MTQNEKSQRYTQLLFEHVKLSNQISNIKSESFEMNEEQMLRIRNLQIRQGNIFAEMKNLIG